MRRHLKVNYTINVPLGVETAKIGLAGGRILTPLLEAVARLEESTASATVLPEPPARHAKLHRAFHRDRHSLSKLCHGEIAAVSG
jgi:hypothetical protein